MKVSLGIWIGCCFCLISCTSTKKLTTYGGIGEDKSIFYYHTGQGEPMVIVHGGPGLNHSYLLPYLNRLNDVHHLIYYDQKACGQAEIPSDTNAMKLRAFVEDIETVRKKFGLKQMHLMAHSWGALLAIQYAALYPQHLKSLILISPAAISSADVREASRLINAKFEHVDQLARSRIIESPAFKNNRPEAMAELIRLSFKQNMSQKNLADSIHIYIPEDFSKRNAALRYLFKDLASYDYYPVLPRITTPTLIICGAQDVGLPFADKIQQTIPSARINRIENSGHFPFIEQPMEFKQQVVQFVSILQIKK
ncbi:MAG: alpha/beta fold hydrolase [Saprospiraceae bacterium]|nr:alpha/beta fold hydrolase [Saprospiraceae bacterium]